MKKLRAKDKRKRKFFKKIENKSFIIKNLQKNFKIPQCVRWTIFDSLPNLNNFKSKTQLSKRCVLTTSKKSFHKVSNFSRMEFSKYANNGSITGIRKSSW